MFNLWIVYIICIIVLPCQAYSHHNNENRLERIESLVYIKYDIKQRSHTFYEKRGQSPSLSTPTKIEHDDQLRLQFHAYNTTFDLHLEPNQDLFHPNSVLHQDGKSEKLTPHLVYKGYVMEAGTSNRRRLGWARILIRHDLMQSNQPIIEGAFQYHHDLYHIKATTNYQLSKRDADPTISDTHMVIYRESDTTQLVKRDTQQHECGFDTLNKPFIQQQQQQQLFTAGGLLTKRFQSGCPTTRKINYMGAAADCTYVQHYKSKDAARIQIINNFNMASAIFEETFNIALGLINITVMEPSCPPTPQPQAWNRVCDANYSLGDRLSDFSQWRSTMSGDGAGLWHLMTNCPTGVEVGLAWLKQLCNTKSTIQISANGKSQHVSGAGVSAITRDEWKVVAHEIGHGFGAIHDCNKGSCPCIGSDCECCPLSSDTCDTGGGYLMTPISNTSAENFSPCSVNTICSAFPTLGHCLYDPQQQTKTIVSLNVCGNGIKEQGEECDTGGQETDCCDPKTCKLKAPAVCEDQNETCCHKCQIQPKTHVCRPSSSPCDIEEYCTGDSPTCPTDHYVPDGVSCGLDLRCASGQCTSRDKQCLSRGFVMNITTSCPTNMDECKLSCAQKTGKCLQFSGYFMDGTPCGQGGYCVSGSCKNSHTWVQSNLKIVIPCCIAAFLFICCSGCLLFWFGCCCCAGYREKRKCNTLPRNDSATDLPTKEVNYSSSSSITVVAEDNINNNK